MSSFIAIAIAIAIVTFSLNLVSATNVKPCRGMTIDKTTIVNIKDCLKPPCILKKKSNVTIEIKFKPFKEVSTLVTNVNAKIGDLPLPFVGIDGKDACKDIYLAASKSKVGCPLTKGTTYIYSRTFYIQPYYPNVNPLVHWSLLEGKTDVVCFELTAKITN